MKTRSNTLLIPLLLLIYLGALWAAVRFVPPSPGTTGMALLRGPDRITCTPWQQVNAGGFDLGPGPDSGDAYPFQAEEGFELIVFNDRLYVGMEADNALGARLWRTRSPGEIPQNQSDWEEVIADSSGLPWHIENLRQVDHIDSLAVFKDRIFASSANSREASGARVFASGTGAKGSWTDVLTGTGPGFGDPGNENYKDMLVFEEQLCGGTWNVQTGAQVWCTPDGESWNLKNTPGFGDPQNSIIWSGEIFDDGLYFSVQHRSQTEGFSRRDSGRIYRTLSLGNTPEWELVFDGGTGTVSAVLLGEQDGELYAATQSIDGIRIVKSATGNPDSWTHAGRPGMSGSRANTGTTTDGAVVYLGRLHVAVHNPLQGFRVWRLDSDGFWRIVHAGTTQNADNIAAQLTVFDGSLYAWTTNYRTGQAVLQTRCSTANEQPGLD